MIHDFQSMVLLDKIVGDAKHSVVLGVPKAGDDAEPALDGQPGQPDTNDDPGAAPNGADYVPLQGANGKVAQGAAICGP